MLIGVDFDNTIVCYDEVFGKVAVEQGLVPPEASSSKGAVRDYLRKIGQEDKWTELQGYIYGPGMVQAKPFPGAIEFFLRCREKRIPAAIISHRTRYPYLGEKHDLHESARNWLVAHGLAGETVFLELSKQEKIARIVQTGCTHFIDDLPELLSEAAFPAIRKILFDPNGHCRECPGAVIASSWEAIERLLGVER